MTNKLSQEKICFLLLYQAKENYLAAWQFVGEKVVLETSKVSTMNVFLSYKSPVRLSTLFYDVDGIERRMVKGASGAKYYEYRFMHSTLDRLPEYLKELI